MRMFPDSGENQGVRNRLRGEIAYIGVKSVGLSDEMHSLSWFHGGSGGALERSEDPCHVSCELSHGLESFDVACGFAGGAAVGDVPILGSDDGHVGHLQGHLEALERSSSAATPADGKDGSGFAPEIATAAIEGALHDTEQSSVGLPIING